MTAGHKPLARVLRRTLSLSRVRIETWMGQSKTPRSRVAPCR